MAESGNTITIPPGSHIMESQDHDQQPSTTLPTITTTTTTTTTPSLHTLLLLSDSALPLGSFAFSSGLESFLAHHSISSPKSPQETKNLAFSTFLTQSLHNIASTTLPYVLAAYNNPATLQDLDNDLDASTPCTVARRASVSQGRAMLGVWERALSSCVPTSSSPAAAAIDLFIHTMKSPSPPPPTTSHSSSFFPQLQAHFAPLFGCVSLALNLSFSDTSYIYLLNHAKAVLSAAVRASVMGPYQSQAVLASAELQQTIKRCVEVYGKEGRHEEAVVVVPMMDLWMGRHEMLYSRIFNS